MKKYQVMCLLFLAVLAGSCRKSPTDDLLQGTWIEQDGEHSKLNFKGDTLYFFHEPEIDTLTYTLDSKHSEIWTLPLNSTTGGRSYQLEWHKKKKILVVLGLFPSAFGNASKNYFKKQ